MDNILSQKNDMAMMGWNVINIMDTNRWAVESIELVKAMGESRAIMVSVNERPDGAFVNVRYGGDIDVAYDIPNVPLTIAIPFNTGDSREMAIMIKRRDGQVASDIVSGIVPARIPHGYTATVRFWRVRPTLASEAIDETVGQTWSVSASGRLLFEYAQKNDMGCPVSPETRVVFGGEPFVAQLYERGLLFVRDGSVDVEKANPEEYYGF